MKVHLLGCPRILGEDGEERPVPGHQPWAVLARVLLSDRPLPRRRIAEELFPNAVDPMGALRWCLASLRRALGPGTMMGDPIEARLPAGTEVDVLEIAQAGFDFDRAGDLLEGADPVAASEFLTWLLVERERLAGLVDAQLRQEAMRALAQSDHARAIHLAGLAARRRPLEEGSQILLVRCLAAAGRDKAAQAHIAATEATFLEELGESPTLALRSAARPTVAAPPAGVSPGAVIESLIESGTAALSAGAVDAGLDCLRRAAADAERTGDRALQARAFLELGTALIHSVRGFDDEGAIHLRFAVELATGVAAAPILCRALQELGYVEALAGRRPSAAAILESAFAASEGDDGRLAGIHSLIGFNLVDWGRREKGLAHFELSLEHARRAGNRRREVWSLGIGGWGQMLAGHHEEAERWLTTALELSAEMRWIAFRPWPLAVLAETRLRDQHAPAHIRESLEAPFALSCQLGDPCWEAAVARATALACEAEGNAEAATDWMEKARRSCSRVTDPYAALLVAIIADQVRLCRKRGDGEGGDRTARDLIALAARTHADGFLPGAMASISQIE